MSPHLELGRHKYWSEMASKRFIFWVIAIAPPDQYPIPNPRSLRARWSPPRPPLASSSFQQSSNSWSSSLEVDSRLKLLRDLIHSGETIRAQRSGHLANPSPNAVASHREAGASAEERLTGQLVVNAGGGQIEKEFIAPCKKISKMSDNEQMDVLNMFWDGEGVGAMGEASLLAVVAQHSRFTMLAVAIAEDAVGASRVELG
ncbi:hypothetical protein B0H14DRAFT_2655703 [Mycena olivaceomarginata]|nr:hypothetical protein B0H14DRAFT_2655703 [Mycena olivaceomarginata]